MHNVLNHYLNIREHRMIWNRDFFIRLLLCRHVGRTTVKVLVTGGAGFIGGHVVDRLVRDGASVRVIDALIEQAHEEEPIHLNDRVEYVFADLNDPTTVAKAVEGIDAVSHQASMVGLETSLADAPDYERNNNLATAMLLKTLADASFRGPVVLASSMVVYGEGRFECDVHGEMRPAPRSRTDLEAARWEPRCPLCGSDLRALPISEEAVCDPRSVYAATKLHQEHLCSVFSRETGSPVSMLRYHNVYGPRMPANTPYAGVASIFRSHLGAGSPPAVYEDGNQLRDFVHVSDVAAANVRALDTSKSGTYNIASGDPRSVLEMATALSTASGTGAPKPMVVGGYRTGDVRHIFASPQRASEVLGWRATIDFEEGMAEFANEPLRNDLARTR